MRRKLQQFFLEEKLEIIYDKYSIEYEEIIEIDKEELIQVMLHIH